MATPNCVYNYEQLRSVAPPPNPPPPGLHLPACAYIFVAGFPGVEFFHPTDTGMEGFFQWQPESLEADNIGTVIKPNAVKPTDKGRWHRLFDGKISVKWFGARGDGNTPDSDAIQAALDTAATTGKGIYLPPGKYKTTATLLIKHDYMTVCADGAIIDFYGAANQAAIDGVRIGPNEVYPIGLRLLNLIVYVQNADAVGICWRFSRSYAESVTVFLPSSDRIAWRLPGDGNGTGPFYNTFVNCVVDGHLETNQIGWDLSVDLATGHAPNANIWLGGRTAGCSTAFSIAGWRNALYGVTVEATTGVCFKVDHPSQAGQVGVAGGTIGTVIDHPYVEGDCKSNPTVLQIGANAMYTRIAAPVISSIGSGTAYSNTGIGTLVDLGDKIDLPGIDFRFIQASATQKPRVQGSHPGWFLSDPSASEIWITNDSATSALGQAFNVWDQMESKYVLQSGVSLFRVVASQLDIGNGTASWFTGAGSPEGAITAPPGSLYSRTEGGGAPALYVKESGTGNVGWVAK